MSAFAANFKTAFDASMVPAGGELITHKPKATGIESAPFLARVKPVQDQVTGKVIRSKRTIVISPTNVAQPVAGDTGTASGRVYRIVEVNPTDGGLWECMVDVGGAA